MLTRRLLIPLLVVCLLTTGTDVALAWFKHFAPFQQGFSHTSVREYATGLVPLPGQTLVGSKAGDPAAGLVLAEGNRITASSPVLANLDDDPKTLEIAVATDDGFLAAYGSAANRLWAVRVVDTATCPPPANDGDRASVIINTAPAIGDVDGDGRNDVVVGYGPINIGEQRQNCPGGVIAYDRNGNLIARFAMPLADFPNQSAGQAVLASPSIVDLDGKGDIVVAAGSNNLYFWILDFKNLAGAQKARVRWRYSSRDTHFSSASFADLNGDGVKEIVVGTDFTPGTVCDPTNNNQVPPKPNIREENRGFLNVFPANPLPNVTFDRVCERDGDLLNADGSFGRDTNGDGRPDSADGVNETIGLGKGFIRRVGFDQAIYSSPAIANIRGDNRPEIIIGASCFYAGTGRWVKIFDADLNLVQTLATPRCVVSSPAIGDVSGDGKPDIVALVGNGNPGDTQQDPKIGEVYAWNGETGAQLWTAQPKSVDGQREGFSQWTNNPVLADLDGNGSVEVLMVVENSLVILNGADGTQLTTDQVNCNPQNLATVNANCRLRSLFMWHSARTTPAVGDLDGDGDLEVVATGGFNNTDNATLSAQRPAMLYVWTDFASFLGSAAGNPANKNATPWPMFKRDAARTGLLQARRLSASGNSAPIIGGTLARGGTRTATYTIASEDGSALSWTATEEDPSNTITLNRTSGNNGDQLVVTVAAPANTTIQQTQTLTGRVVVSAEGFDAPLEITVNLTVGNFQTTYLSLIGR